MAFSWASNGGGVGVVGHDHPGGVGFDGVDVEGLVSEEIFGGGEPDIRGHGDLAGGGGAFDAGVGDGDGGGFF